MGLTARLRQLLFTLCQSRSAQCSPTLCGSSCRSEGDAIVIAREQDPLTRRR